MEDNKKIVISDSELAQYLEIASKVLNIARTELDTKRLKEIVSALKNGEYAIIHEETPKRITAKKDKQIVIAYLDKIQRGQDVSCEEKEVFDAYCEKHILFKLAVNQSFEKLYSELSNQKGISKDDIVVIYQYLVGKEAKSLTLEKMIDGIKQHIYKLKNFNDMDEKFHQNKEKLY